MNELIICNVFDPLSTNISFDKAFYFIFIFENTNIIYFFYRDINCHVISSNYTTMLEA